MRPEELSGDMTFPELRRDAPGPAFAEPWQARAFALAILASRQGCFTWSEWSRALALELQRAADAGAHPQAADRSYFECWLRALQSLLVGKRMFARAELGERKRAWEDAYRRTPHGVPVSLPSA
jgi:nitrile hydratase accessory protein